MEYQLAEKIRDIVPEEGDVINVHLWTGRLALDIIGLS